MAELLAERTSTDAEAWVGVAEAASHLGCPKSRIYALASAHRISHEKDGSRLPFKRSLLDEWVRRGGGKRP